MLQSCLEEHCNVSTNAVKQSAVGWINFQLSISVFLYSSCDLPYPCGSEASIVFLLLSLPLLLVPTRDNSALEEPTHSSGRIALV